MLPSVGSRMAERGTPGTRSVAPSVNPAAPLEPSCPNTLKPSAVTVPTGLAPPYASGPMTGAVLPEDQALDERYAPRLNKPPPRRPDISRDRAVVRVDVSAAIHPAALITGGVARNGAVGQGQGRRHCSPRPLNHPPYSPRPCCRLTVRVPTLPIPPVLPPYCPRLCWHLGSGCRSLTAPPVPVPRCIALDGDIGQDHGAEIEVADTGAPLAAVLLKMAQQSKVRLPELSIPPPTYAVLRSTSTLLKARMPALSIPPPSPRPSVTAPPLILVFCSVRFPVAPTARIRNSSALSRLMSLSLPSMVSGRGDDRQAGGAKGGVVHRCQRVGALGRQDQMSAPLPAAQPPVTMSLLAAVMASTRVQSPPGVDGPRQSRGLAEGAEERYAPERAAPSALQGAPQPTGQAGEP